MISFNEGSLFCANDNRITPLADGILYTGDFTTSDKEEPEINWMMLGIKKDVDMSFEIQSVDLNLLDKISRIPTSNNFTLTYERPIMIQARWHKRHRTNKKWLKRYGMKPDTVNVSCNANTCEYDTYDCTFDIDTNSFQYNLKPHQKRKGLKIQW